MGKFRQISTKLWPLIYVKYLVWYYRLMLCICSKLNLRGGVSCMPAALLFLNDFLQTLHMS